MVRSQRFFWDPALRLKARQSTRGGWLHVLRRLFWCFSRRLYLYAVSSLTYAIRPECSARLVVIKALGSQRWLGIWVASEFYPNRPKTIQNVRKQLCIYEQTDTQPHAVRRTLHFVLCAATKLVHAYRAVLSGRCQVKEEAAYKNLRRLHALKQQTGDMKPAAQYCLMGCPIETTRRSHPAQVFKSLHPSNKAKQMVLLRNSTLS